MSDAPNVTLPLPLLRSCQFSLAEWVFPRERHLQMRPHRLAHRQQCYSILSLQQRSGWSTLAWTAANIITKTSCRSLSRGLWSPRWANPSAITNSIIFGCTAECKSQRCIETSLSTLIRCSAKYGACTWTTCRLKTRVRWEIAGRCFTMTAQTFNCHQCGKHYRNSRTCDSNKADSIYKYFLAPEK